MLGGQNKNIESSQNLINFHMPEERLKKRVQVEAVLKAQKIMDKIPSQFDIFSIIDAVVRRGGPQEIRRKHRFDEIALSLSYYKYQFLKIYEDFILPYQRNIFNKLKFSINNDTFLEHHLLPTKSSSLGYDLTDTENQIISQHFNYLDEYYNIKTLAYFKYDYNLVPTAYVRKLFIVKKYLLFSGMISNLPQKELKIMGLHNLHQSLKIGIVGCTLSNVVLAYKLADLGVKVKIYDNQNQKNIEKWRAGYFNELIKQGVFLTDAGDSYLNLFKQLSNLGFETQKIKVTGANIKLQDGTFATAQRINRTQEIFLQILHEMLVQGNGKELFFVDLDKKVKKKKLQADKELFDWHLMRYVSFHKMKKDYTYISDIQKYFQKSNKLKLLNTSSFEYFPYEKNLQSIQKLAEKGVELTTDVYQSIEYLNGKWKITAKNSKDQISQDEFTHIIYSDSQKVTNAIFMFNYKIPQIKGGQIFKEGFPILQQLRCQADLHYIFRFKEKVSFRDTNASVTSNFLTMKEVYRIEKKRIHFILLNNNYDVYAITDDITMKYDFYNEILLMLTEKVLKKNCLLEQGKLMERKLWYNMKDERFIESLIKIRENEKLYFNIPVHSINFINQLYSEHQNNCLIMSMILKSISKLNYFDEKQYNEVKRKQPSKDPQRDTHRSNKQTRDFGFRQKDSRTIKVQQPQISIQISRGGYERTSSKEKQSSRIVILNDFIGLSNSIVKNYKQFVLNQLQHNSAINNSLLRETPLSKIPLLAVTQPIQIYPDIWLQNLGYPILFKNNEQWYPINGYVSRRHYYSITNPNISSIYYQCIIIVKSIQYFCIVQENKLNSIVYYHTNQKYLYENFNNAIEKKRQKMNVEKFKRNPFSYQKPQYLFPYVLKAIIVKEQENNKTKLKLDQILQAKLYQRHLESLECFSFYYNDQVDSILREIQWYLTSIISVNNLKKYKLGQVLIGKLNPIFVVWQVMGLFDGELKTEDEIKQKDPQLYSQIKRVSEKQQKEKMKYLLKIEKQDNEQGITIKRNFLNLHYNRQSFFTFQYEEKQIMNYPENTNIYNHWTKEIISQSLKRFNSHEIIEVIKDLINYQIQEVREMGEKLKFYFKMTRIQRVQANQESVKRTNQQLRQIERDRKRENADINEHEMQILMDNYKQGNLLVCNGQIVCLF